MTLPASGPLVLGLASGGNSINSEFGYGNDLGSYRGVYYGLGGQEFRFPVSPNSIAMNLFYSTYKIVGGSRTFNSTQSFVIPVYNTMTITVQGGGGSTGGSPGYNACVNQPTPGSSGNTGGSSSFFTVSAAGGAGGVGTSGAGQPGQIVTTTFTNPVQGGNGPVSGSTASAIVAVSAAGGQGGPNAGIVNPFGCLGPSFWGYGPTGAAGAAGYVSVSWA